MKWIAFVLVIMVISFQMKDQPRRSLWNSGSPVTVKEAICLGLRM
jgi:hypothetical protein